MEDEEGQELAFSWVHLPEQLGRKEERAAPRLPGGLDSHVQGKNPLQDPKAAPNWLFLQQTGSEEWQRGSGCAPAAVPAASCSKGSPGPKIARYHYLHLIEGVLNATSTTHKPNGK